VSAETSATTSNTNAKSTKRKKVFIQCHRLYAMAKTRP